jgi:hypothetical protein
MRSTGSTAQIYERHTVPALLLHGRHALRGKNMQYDGTCVPYVHGHGVRIHYQTEGDRIAGGCLMPGGTGAVRSPTNLPLTSHRCLLPTCSQCWTISTSRRPTSAVTPGGRIGFVIAKYAPERFSSFIVGGASHPYPENRDAFALWLQELRKGAGAIAPLWEVPLSPGLQARLLTNDMDAIVAYWRQRMESPGFEEVLTDPAYAVLALCWGGGRPICQCQGSRHAHAQARRILFRSDLVRPHDMRFLATVPC